MSTTTTRDVGLARQLARAAADGQSGIVAVLRGKHKRLFCLSEGKLVFAASNLIEEQFSEILLREQMITPSDLASARVDSEKLGTTLARFLIDEDIVAAAAIGQALEHHVRQLVYATLDWPNGDSSFSIGQPELNDEVLTELNCIDLIFDYTREHPSSFDELRRRTGAENACPVVSEEHGKALSDSAYWPTVQPILARCGEAVTLEQLVRESDETEELTWRAFYALRLVGVFEALSGPSARESQEDLSRTEIATRLDRAKHANHYTLLKVPTGATSDAIRQAYYAIARDYHPDRFRHGPLSDLRETMESYFAQATEAYNTLTNPESRAAYNTELAADAGGKREYDTIAVAKENFARGMELVGKGHFSEAVQWLENAIDQDAGNAVYRLELGKLMANNPRLRKQAIEHLVEANRIDPSLAEGYLALGKLYLKRDNKAQAAQLFREVLRWEPGHLEAGSLLKKIKKA